MVSRLERYKETGARQRRKGEERILGSRGPPSSNFRLVYVNRKPEKPPVYYPVGRLGPFIRLPLTNQPEQEDLG